MPSVSLKSVSVIFSLIFMPTVAIAQTISLSPPTLEESDAAKAATPKIMLEKSQSYVLDDYIRAFRAPTRDSSGKIHYYDLTIELEVDANGKPRGTARVSVSRSPTITSRAIVAGTYKASDGSICNVTNMTLSNGRIQSFFTCDERGRNFELSVATGSITAGHPYLDQLIAAKINRRSDVDTYAWGLTTYGNFAVFPCGNHYSRSPVGVKTNGNQLILFIFSSRDGSFDCNGAFTRQP